MKCMTSCRETNKQNDKRHFIKKKFLILLLFSEQRVAMPAEHNSCEFIFNVHTLGYFMDLNVNASGKCV